MNCKSENGVISITGLTITEAQRIKIAEQNLSLKNLPNTTREEQRFNFKLIGDINTAQNALAKNFDNEGIACSKNGAIDIAPLALEDAHHIKIALIHANNDNLRGTTREDQSFSSALVIAIDQAEDFYYRMLDIPALCV